MKKLLSAGILAVAIAVMPAAADETPKEPTTAAMTFVGGFSNDHLSGMLSRFGARDARLAAMSQINGSMVALTLDAAIADAVRAHGPAWQRNLALSWTPLMNDEELTSLTTAGAQSPHVDKYLELRETAGQSMQTLSQDLFREILGEVLDATLSALSEAETPAK